MKSAIRAIAVLAEIVWVEALERFKTTLRLASQRVIWISYSSTVDHCFAKKINNIYYVAKKKKKNVDYC